MPSKNHVAFLPILTLIIGTTIGGGAIWKYYDYNMQKIIKTNEMRRQLDLYYSDIISLTDEYINITKKELISHDIDNNRKISLLKTRLNLLKDNFTALENNLASLEGRQPRIIKLEFIFVPEQPKGLVIK